MAQKFYSWKLSPYFLDTLVYERLGEESSDLKDKTQNHLDVSIVDFAFLAFFEMVIVLLSSAIFGGALMA